MKILLTSDVYSPIVNGVVTSLLNLKNELESRGHDVRIITLSPNLKTHKEGNIYYIGSFSLNKIYPNMRMRHTTTRPFFNEISAWHPDVVHSQSEFSTSGFGKRVADKLDIPFVHTYHTVYENYTHYFCFSKRLGKKIASFLSRIILNKTDTVVAPSDKVQSLLSDYKVTTHIKTIPTGIDVGRFGISPSAEWIASAKAELGIADDELTPIFVGRLAKEKNISELMSFMADLKERRIHLLVVGGGPYLDELKREAAQMGVSDRIVFTGMIDPEDVSKYYHLGNVFVNASTSETQGLTYIEGLAAGLPCICRRDAALNNVITDGVNGWQYDSREDFTSRILQLADNPLLVKQMSQKASEMAVMRFSTASFADDVLSLYVKLCNEFNVVQNEQTTKN